MKKHNAVLILILTVATFIRLWSVTTIPVGVHRDQILFDWNAYSILKTARDEHGRFMPLSFEGFGIADYPLAIYLRVPFVAIFGFTNLAGRVGIVFYSIVTIFLIYKLAQKLFADEVTALISAVVATFFSWHFFMSRTGYTISMYALMFLLWGIYWLLFGKHRWQSVVGGIFLALTCFTYAAYYFFLPPFLLLLAVAFLPKLKKDKDIRLGFAMAFLLTLLAFVIFWVPSLKRAPQAAFYYKDPGIRFQWADKPVGEVLAQGKPYDFTERILHEPRMAYVFKAIDNYIAGFSTNFWLKTGRGFESNVDGFGNLLIYEPALILIGLLRLIWLRSKLGLFLLLWVIAGPLASTFTKDVATTRLMQMIPPFVFLEAFAFKYLIFDLFLKLKPKLLSLLALALVFAPILFINALYFDAYFRHMPAYAGRWWYKGYLEVVDVMNKYPDKTVYFKGKADFAYLFVVFKNKYDPALFQRQVKREVNDLNLSTVTSFGRYNFVDTIDPLTVCRDFNSLYIQKSERGDDLPYVPDGKITSLGADTFYYFVPTMEKCAVNLQSGI